MATDKVHACSNARLTVKYETDTQGSAWWIVVDDSEVAVDFCPFCGARLYDDGSVGLSHASIEVEVREYEKQINSEWGTSTHPAIDDPLMDQKSEK